MNQVQSSVITVTESDIEAAILRAKALVVRTIAIKEGAGEMPQYSINTWGHKIMACKDGTFKVTAFWEGSEPEN